MATTYNKENGKDNLTSKAIETEDGRAVSNEVVVSDKNIEGINFGLQLKDQFNLNIKKCVTKAIVTENNKPTEYKFDNLELAKVEIAAKKLNKSSVEIEYKIIVENIGNVDGFATMINDYVPEGMEFEETKNNGWYSGKDGMLYNETLKDTVMKPGEKKELTLVLTKKMNNDNTGTVSNKVSISATLNENSLQENVSDNVATQQMLILVKTGYTVPIIIVIAIIGMAIIVIINKDKLIKINKNYKNENKSNRKSIFKKLYK